MTNIKFSKAGQNLPRHLKIKTISFKEFNQMYMPKPTWEEEFDKKFDHEQEFFICKALKTDEPKDCDCELKEIKAFIQKVHDEAYERGYEQAREDMLHEVEDKF